MSWRVLAHWPSLMKVGPDDSVTHSRASSQPDAKREESSVSGERRRSGPNLRRRTSARRLRRRRKTSLCTCTAATAGFLSVTHCVRLAA